MQPLTFTQRFLFLFQTEIERNRAEKKGGGELSFITV